MERPAELRPIVQALILADHVYRDQATHKFVIAGTFRQILVPSFPVQYTWPVAAYVSLTNLRGKIALHLRFVDLRDLKVLVQTPALSVDSEDPLASIELACQVGSLPLPHAGTYALEVAANGEPIGSLRILAAQFQRPPGAPPDAG